MPESALLEKPLAIIGEEDTVLGFKALGFKVYPIREEREFSLALDEVVTQRAAVCLIQENIYQAQAAQLSTYKNLPLPIFIPFANGSAPLTISTERSRGAKEAKTDLLEKIVKDIRLKATGTF